MECHLAQAHFSIGEPVNIWCTFNNTTDSVKPIGWHPYTGSHFCCVQGDKAGFVGVLPRAYPQLRPSIVTGWRPVGSIPCRILFLPPQESIQILLTYKAELQVKFKGKVLYDPLAPRGGWTIRKGESSEPPWKDEWVSSNRIEYEVVALQEE